MSIIIIRLWVKIMLKCAYSTYTLHYDFTVKRSQNKKLNAEQWSRDLNGLLVEKHHNGLLVEKDRTDPWRSYIYNVLARSFSIINTTNYTITILKYFSTAEYDWNETFKFDPWHRFFIISPTNQISLSSFLYSRVYHYDSTVGWL